MPITFNISNYFPITDPTWAFFVVLMIILCAPIIMGKLRIPHIVGMVLAGVVIGKYGLHILERDTSFELFGKVGLYYILFLAALEMDIEGLKKNKFRFNGVIGACCHRCIKQWHLRPNVLGRIFAQVYSLLWIPHTCNSTSLSIIFASL